MLKKITNKKDGFTLAELLIVVAIIAVLTAIAIPVFTSQLEKAREATDMSNLRAAYAEVATEYLANGATKPYYAEVTLKQQKNGWQNSENGKLYTRVDGVEKAITIDDSIVTKGSTVFVNIDGEGTVTVTATKLDGASKIGGGEGAGGEGGGTETP